MRETKPSPHLLFRVDNIFQFRPSSRRAANNLLCKSNARKQQRQQKHFLSLFALRESVASKTMISLLLFLLLFFVATVRAGFVISEIMYSPRLLDGVLEYIELYNDGATKLSIDGYQLRSLFTFPPGSIANANSYLIVARNKTQFLK